MGRGAAVRYFPVRANGAAFGRTSPSIPDVQRVLVGTQQARFGPGKSLSGLA